MHCVYFNLKFSAIFITQKQKMDELLVTPKIKISGFKCKLCIRRLNSGKELLLLTGLDSDKVNLRGDDKDR